MMRVDLSVLNCTVCSADLAGLAQYPISTPTDIPEITLANREILDKFLALATRRRRS
jgi:hypothetical protein